MSDLKAEDLERLRGLAQPHIYSIFEEDQDALTRLISAYQEREKQSLIQAAAYTKIIQEQAEALKRADELAEKCANGYTQYTQSSRNRALAAYLATRKGDTEA